jgi:hypothetical protein
MTRKDLPVSQGNPINFSLAIRYAPAAPFTCNCDPNKAFHALSIYGFKTS